MHRGFTATALELQFASNSLTTDVSLLAVLNSSSRDPQVLLGGCWDPFPQVCSVRARTDGLFTLVNYGSVTTHSMCLHFFPHNCFAGTFVHN